jgi:mono/diheme cytochrome c family protein
MTKSPRTVWLCGAAAAVAIALVVPAQVGATSQAEATNEAELEAVNGDNGTEADNALDEAGEPTYTVIDGRADPATIMGYTVYTGTCMPCHGPDGLGSSFAPSLIRAAERRTFEQFEETVRDGRSVLPGQVMPAFADDQRVMDNVDNIWRYLKARADGELGRGRPQPIEANAGEQENTQ